MSAIQMMNFTFMAVTFLLICIETPEIWSDTNDDDDDFEEILIFHQVMMRAFFSNSILFLKLCHMIDIYHTPPGDLLTRYGNYPRQ